MNIDFEKHILDLLKNNQCVVLPGFGAFILKSVPSIIHQNAIYPPAKQIDFNRSLIHDDELLTGALMGTYGLEYAAAKNQVLSYANQQSYTLKKEQSVSFKQLGMFVYGANQQIIFKPGNSTLVDKEAFGFNKLLIKPIAKEIIPAVSSTKENRKVEIKEEILEAKVERKQDLRKKSKLPLVGLIASFLLIVGLSALVFTDTHFVSGSVQKAGFIDMFFPKDTHVTSFDNQVSSNLQLVNPINQKEHNTRDRIFSISDNKLANGYYLVLGSYTSMENAERLEKTLFESGRDSYIIPALNGNFRVCVFADENYLLAKSKLDSSTTNYQDVWLLKNETSN